MSGNEDAGTDTRIARHQTVGLVSILGELFVWTTTAPLSSAPLSDASYFNDGAAMKRRLLLLAGMIFVCACSGNNSVSPSSSSSSTASLAGNWAGTVTSNTFVNQVGIGTLHATIAQNGSSMNGSWNVAYSNPANNNAGSLTGIITGNSVTLTMTSGVATACPFNVTATLNGSTAMSGTYATFNCTVADGGQFAANKQ